MKTLQYSVLSASILLLLSSCETSAPCIGTDEECIDYQTEILSFSYSPQNPVPGDTVRFDVVIKDSLDTSFRYYWYGRHGKFLLGSEQDVGSYNFYHFSKITIDPAQFLVVPDSNITFTEYISLIIDNGDTKKTPMSMTRLFTIREQ